MLKTALLVVVVALAGCKKEEQSAVGKPPQSSSAASIVTSSSVASVTFPDKIDASGLDAAGKQTFAALIDSLSSPCGKAHSLKKSVTSDDACKVAPLAAAFVKELVKDGAKDSDVREFYNKRYTVKKSKVTIDTAGAPAFGPNNAPVTLVEFFDYGCPACAFFSPPIERAAKENIATVKVVYMMYPLPSHKDSGPAAQAALAAHKQGKFKEMHKKLFANQTAHKKANLDAYAKAIGLDMAQYAKDYDAAKAVVEAHKKVGESIGVQGTPTIYINGQSYDGPPHEKYFGMSFAEATMK